jgi:hypothetical protein
MREVLDVVDPPGQEEGVTSPARNLRLAPIWRWHLMLTDIQ